MTLLSTDSLQYKRRLVRALNSEGMLNGFYASTLRSTHRCNRARIKGGALEVHASYCTPEWFTPWGNSFCDVYGRQIYASIHA